VLRNVQIALRDELVVAAPTRRIYDHDSEPSRRNLERDRRAGALSSSFAREHRDAEAGSGCSGECRSNDAQVAAH
jgi:hypothetical protein